MNNMRPTTFTGFSAKSLAFLKGLEEHNDKLWFEAHRHEYEEHLLGPMRSLASDLGELMLSIDPLLEIRPAVNKTISRIYRDTRFSRSKLPFRTTMWITFKRPGDGWQDRPGYFFEIAPDSYRYGMGFYAASSSTMSALREMIYTHSKELKKAVSALSEQKDFVVEGQMYKRLRRKETSEEMPNWYQRKNIYVVCNRKADSRLFGAQVEMDLRSGFLSLASLYHLFARLS